MDKYTYKELCSIYVSNKLYKDDAWYEQAKWIYQATTRDDIYFPKTVRYVVGRALRYGLLSRRSNV